MSARSCRNGLHREVRVARRPRSRVAAVVVVDLCLVAVAWAAWRWLPQDALPASLNAWTLPWWGVAMVFAVVEYDVLRLRLRHTTHPASLTEIGTVLALVFAHPAAFVLGRIAGGVPVFALRQRPSPMSLVVTGLLRLAAACVALLTFTVVRAGETFPQPRVVLALFAGALAGALLSALFTRLVIALDDGGLRLAEVLVGTWLYLPFPLVVGTFALVGAYALDHNVQSAWALGVSVVVVAVCFRAYASLSDRHLSLERLYQLNQLFTVRADPDQVLRQLLEQARDVLRALVAEVTFLGTDGAGSAQVRLAAGGAMQRVDGPQARLPGWVHDELMAGRAVLAPRGARDRRVRELLRARSASEMILVPIAGEGGIIAVLAVAQRRGGLRTFDRGDARLLQAVANHTGVALQNGRLIDRLRYDELHDALTGLPNRVKFRTDAQHHVEYVQVGRCEGFAVMILDLDGFKEVNDTLGHQHGDRLLIEVAARLQRAAGRGATVARLGGDEFAVLLPDVWEPDVSLATGRRLLAVLEAPVVLDHLRCEVQGSVGIAIAPKMGFDVSSLMRRADIAMYAAKTAGAGAKIYEPSMETHSPQRLSLMGDLREAIRQNDLAVYVQPKARLSTGQVVGVEALIRWHHPERGLIGPDDFVPVAERSGLIRPLTLSVLDQALAAQRMWAGQGADMSISVNLSARSLTDPSIVEDVARARQARAVNPARLTLEITETSVMTDTERSLATLSELHDLGVKLSVDDFGSGYSALSYLKLLPVQEVKIDKLFVHDLDTDADNASIVRSIVALGRDLDLEVVAEGVENVETWAHLQRLGCDIAQGYYLSRPMPVPDFVSWLRHYRMQARPQSA